MAAPKVPIRSRMFDNDGHLKQIWLRFFQYFEDNINKFNTLNIGTTAEKNPSVSGDFFVGFEADGTPMKVDHDNMPGSNSVKVNIRPFITDSDELAKIQAYTESTAVDHATYINNALAYAATIPGGADVVLEAGLYSTQTKIHNKYSGVGLVYEGAWCLPDPTTYIYPDSGVIIKAVTGHTGDVVVSFLELPEFSTGSTPYDGGTKLTPYNTNQRFRNIAVDCNGLVDIGIRFPPCPGAIFENYSVRESIEVGIMWAGWFPTTEESWYTGTVYSEFDSDAGSSAHWVNHGGTDYYCIQAHTSGATTEPGVGVDWATYWATFTPSAVGETFNDKFYIYSLIPVYNQSEFMINRNFYVFNDIAFNTSVGIAINGLWYTDIVMSNVATREGDAWVIVGDACNQNKIAHSSAQGYPTVWTANTSVTAGDLLYDDADYAEVWDTTGAVYLKDYDPATTTRMDIYRVENDYTTGATSAADDATGANLTLIGNEETVARALYLPNSRDWKFDFFFAGYSAIVMHDIVDAVGELDYFRALGFGPHEQTNTGRKYTSTNHHFIEDPQRENRYISSEECRFVREVAGDTFYQKSAVMSVGDTWTTAHGLGYTHDPTNSKKPQNAGTALTIASMTDKHMRLYQPCKVEHITGGHEFTYDLTPTFNIDTITSGTKTIVLDTSEESLVNIMSVGATITLADTTGGTDDGSYTVASYSYDGTNTSVVTNEAIPADDTTGTLTISVSDGLKTDWKIGIDDYGKLVFSNVKGMQGIGLTVDSTDSSAIFDCQGSIDRPYAGYRDVYYGLNFLTNLDDNFDITNAIYNNQSVTYLNGTGTVAEVNNNYCYTRVLNASGHLTEGVNFRAGGLRNSTGTCGTMINFKIQQSKTTGQITNQYGLYSEYITGATTVNDFIYYENSGATGALFRVDGLGNCSATSFTGDIALTDRGTGTFPLILGEDSGWGTGNYTLGLDADSTLYFDGTTNVLYAYAFSGIVVASSLQIGPTTITATGAEINSVCDVGTYNADTNHQHTIVAMDTDATGAELTTLTDGSDAGSLHYHKATAVLQNGANINYTASAGAYDVIDLASVTFTLLNDGSVYSESGGALTCPDAATYLIKWGLAVRNSGTTGELFEGGVFRDGTLITATYKSATIAGSNTWDYTTFQGETIFTTSAATAFDIRLQRPSAENVRIGLSYLYIERLG